MDIKVPDTFTPTFTPLPHLYPPLFFLLLDVFVSATIREAWYRSLFFLITLPLGMYLLRAVRREVLAREKIQHLNKKLQRANKEIKKVYKAKSEFLDIASHQLRTPVTVIVGTLDMFREGSVDALPKEKRDEMLRLMEGVQCGSFRVRLPEFF